jgi:hypothetical protein
VITYTDVSTERYRQAAALQPHFISILKVVDFVDPSVEKALISMDFAVIITQTIALSPFSKIAVVFQ